MIGFFQKKGRWIHGYTSIELVVVASIMIGISGIVLVGFGRLNGTVALNRSARELGVSLRRAQNMSLAVSGVPALANEVPPAVGVQLTRGATSYILFGDRVSSQDNRYTSVSERISTTPFERGVSVHRFLDAVGNEITSTGVLHILFAAPEADPVVTNSSGNGDPLWSKVDIILRAPNGEERRVTVRVSGQIHVD